MKKTLSLAAVLFAASLSLAATVSVTTPQVFNSPELSGAAPGLRAAIASRLFDPALEVSTSDSPASPPEWEIKTSITNIGGAFSIDAELARPDGSRAGERAFEMADSADKIMPALLKIAEKLKAKILEGEAGTGREPAARRPATPTGGRVTGIDLSAYKLEGQISGEVLSLIASDLDGDGQGELLALLRGGELALIETAPSFAEVWRKPLEISFDAACASAGDIDKDGKLELFVTGSREENVYTRGFRVDAMGVKEAGDEAWAFIRLGEHSSKGVILYGIPSIGGLDVLGPNLYQYNWDGVKFTRGEKIPTPDAVSPVNVEWLESSTGPKMLSLTDSAGRLRFYGEAMEKLYSSEDPYKGGRAYFVGNQSQNQLGFISAHIEVNTPAVSFGGLIYMHDNLESVRLTRSNDYENSSLVALRWDGVTLARVSESPKFSGFFTALALDGKAGRIFGSLVKTKGILIKGYNTQIISF